MDEFVKNDDIIKKYKEELNNKYEELNNKYEKLNDKYEKLNNKYEKNNIIDNYDVAKAYDDAVKKERINHEKWLKEMGLYIPPFILEINETEASEKLKYLHKGDLISPKDVILYCGKCQCKDKNYVKWANINSSINIDFGIMKCQQCYKLDTIYCKKCKEESTIINWETIYMICSDCEHKYIPDDYAIKNKPNEPGISFRRTKLSCKGHWFKFPFDDVKCMDCNFTEDCCYNVEHCCCK